MFAKKIPESLPAWVVEPPIPPHPPNQPPNVHAPNDRMANTTRKQPGGDKHARSLTHYMKSDRYRVLFSKKKTVRESDFGKTNMWNALVKRLRGSGVMARADAGRRELGLAKYSILGASRIAANTPPK